MKTLYKFYWDAGRHGCVEGLFIEDSESMEQFYGRHVYFGEILGKHSEVEGTLDREHITVVSEDEEKIEWLESVLGRSVSGYNPVEYMQEYDNDEEE